MKQEFSDTFDGNARDLITFADNRRLKRAVFGTEKKLFEHDGDRIVDITPVSVSVQQYQVPLQ